jgi:hypothetical protein
MSVAIEELSVRIAETIYNLTQKVAEINERLIKVEDEISGSCVHWERGED